MNVYFCGMIGSGKTTIGKHISKTLRLDFYDLDEEMDKTLGYSFHRLVQEQGWVAFRELEYSICKRFSRMDEAIVCLGGGTVRYEWNMDVLAGTGLFIMLEAPLEVLAARVRAADRPRVNPGRSLEEDLMLIWEESRDKYYRAADIVYSTDNTDIEQAVAELIELISEYRLQPR